MNPVVPTVELARLLVGEADDATGDDLVIVPVVATDFQERLLRTIVEAAGGAYVDAAAMAPGAEGPVDEHLAAFVAETLIVKRGGGDIRASVGFADGRVRVDLTNTPEGVESSNPAHLSLRGAATALFSTELRNRPLAVLAYDEGAMDRPVADALGLFLTQQLLGQSLGQVRVLVVLMRNQIDYERHCGQRVASVRYHIDASRCRVRSRREDNLPRIGSTARLRTGATVIFLGAGFSRSSGIPLAQELRNEALRLLLASDAGPDRLIENFRQFLRNKDRFLAGENSLGARDFAAGLTLERVLREEFHQYGGAENSPTLKRLEDANAAASKRPGKAVMALGDVLKVPSGLVVVTVNLDTLIEDATGAALDLYVTDEEFARFPEEYARYRDRGGRVPLLKLHGSISNRGGVVASVDQTLAGLSAAKRQALEALLPANGRVPWIYVGYSMRDNDLLPVFSAKSFGERTDETWVSPFPEDAVEIFVGRQRTACWYDQPQFRIRMVTETADSFMRAFADEWGAVGIPATR